MDRSKWLAIAFFVFMLTPTPVLSDVTEHNGETKFTASDAAGFDSMGYSVAVDGDRVLIGSPWDDDAGTRSGSAYLYEVNPAGGWTETKLTASDAASFDDFGYSVALDGDRVVVGAHQDDVSVGSAYLFEPNGAGGWSQTTKLTASDGERVDRFGRSVAVSGDRILIGAHWDDDNGANSGSAYLFEPTTGGTWTETRKFVASDGAAGDEFGDSLAIDGDRVLIGAWGTDDHGSNSGSAYLFQIDPLGAWTETKIIPTDSGAGDQFGWSVSVSGDRLLIGADHDADNGFQSGSAYVFELDALGAMTETKITPSDGAQSDNFGHSVAVDGDRLLVGAWDDDDNGYRSGGAYLFEADGASGWTETKFIAGDGAVSDRFGWSVDIGGDRVLISAPWDDDDGNDSGSAYLYTVGCLPASLPLVSGVTAPGGLSKLTANDGAAGDALGWSVAVDGERILMGAPQDDERGNNRGSAYLLEPDCGGGWTQTKLLANDGVADDRFGSAVAINGDRIVIGAPGDGDNGFASGSAYLFERDAAGAWVQTEKFLASDGANTDNFGSSVDLDGHRIIVGAQWANLPNARYSGSAYLFQQNAAGLWVETKFTASDAAERDGFGRSVAVDGERILIGAFGDQDAGRGTGSAYMFESDPLGTWKETKLMASDAGPGAFFGWGVDLSGDRAVIGAPGAVIRGDATGTAYLFERNLLGDWAQTLQVTANDRAAGDRFGHIVAVDGARFIIGAAEDDDNGFNTGSAHMFNLDGSSTWVGTKILPREGEDGDQFGYSVAVGGDRVVIGAPWDDEKDVDAGSVYLYDARCLPVSLALPCGGMTWDDGTDLSASDAAAGDRFGYSVAASGERLLIGAYGNGDRGPFSGSAYLLESDGLGGWTETKKFTASDGARADVFGYSVAIDGDRVLIGAYQDGPGSAYVYELDALGGWTETKLTPGGGIAPGSSFGWSVAIDGDRILIGAYTDSPSGYASGSAYLFELNGAGVWTQTHKFTAADGATYDYFGESVDISGDRVVIGAFNDGDNGFGSGSAYVFEPNGAGGWSETKILPSDPSERSNFGGSVAVDGDLVLIAAEADGTAGLGRGSAYLFEPNGAGGWTETKKIVASDAANGDYFGRSVAVAGDRLLIGAFRDDVDGPDRGSAYLFEASSSGGWSETKFTASNGADYDQFGWSVALAGDHLVMGAPSADTHGDKSGTAYVFSARCLPGSLPALFPSGC